MTGSPVIARYVSEISSRCGLLLALYSRPHSSECAVSEHLAVIDALVAGDVAAAVKVMESHLEAVANRALIMPSTRKSLELSDILDSYAGETPPERVATAKPRKR
jgi:DNA-binding GntR family transcriptional regulator